MTISTSDCDVLLRSSHTKRSGIMREIPLSMRVPSVVPRYAVVVGSLKHCAEGERRLGKHMRKGENFILGLFGEPVMIFNKNINQTYDKSGIKSGVKKIFQKK